jgi:hypothetical protein
MPMPIPPFGMPNSSKVTASVQSPPPRSGQVLTFDGVNWAPGTAPQSGTTYVEGNGINISGDTITATNTTAMWNANQLASRLVDPYPPAYGDILRFNGDYWEAQSDSMLIQEEASFPRWNADRLYNTPLSHIAPDSGNVLVFDGRNWSPEQAAEGIEYRAGNGINIQGSTISARANDTLWNAHKLQGRQVAATAPTSGQALVYDGSKWRPVTVPTGQSQNTSGWTVRPGQYSNRSDIVTDEDGFVGIGTNSPRQQLDIAGAVAINGTTVIDASGNWVGTFPTDPAVQSQLDSLQDQQDQLVDLMEQMQGVSDDINAGMDQVNAGMDQVNEGKDDLAEALANDSDTTAAMNTIRDGIDQINAGSDAVDDAKSDMDDLATEISAAVSVISAAASAASAAISAASAAVAAIAAAEATVAAAEATAAAAEGTVAAAEATAAAAEGTVAAAEATLAALEATGAALEASLSAIDASGDAIDASADALAASSSADDASGFAEDASESADDASDSADDASGFANDAKSHSDAANTSAQDAATSADSASNSAAAAAQSAQDARDTINSSLHGDLSGTIANATVTGLRGHPVDNDTPNEGEVLTWKNNKWQPKPLPGDSAVGDTGWRPVTIHGKTALVSTVNGPIGIGTMTPDTSYKLSVNGWIRSKKVVVESGWADYVLAQDYALPPLDSVQAYIRAHGHLPGVTPAREVQAQGLDLGKAQTEMMAKIEELTLYLLQMKEENETLRKELYEIKQQLED